MGQATITIKYFVLKTKVELAKSNQSADARVMHDIDAPSCRKKCKFFERNEMKPEALMKVSKGDLKKVLQKIDNGIKLPSSSALLCEYTY